MGQQSVSKLLLRFSVLAIIASKGEACYGLFDAV